MQRLFILFFVLASFSFFANSQSHMPVIEDYHRFINSKTMVVLDEVLMSDFNMQIEEIMERSWFITPFEIISSSEFDKMKHDDEYSFLLTTIVTFDRDKTRARYNFLSLLMGEKDADIRTMPDLCSLPLSYLDVDDSSYSYKLEAFILFMQQHVKNALVDTRYFGEKGFSRYNRNRPSLNGKKLLLVKEDLAKEISTSKAIAAVYPYDFEIVSKEEITEAIARKDPDVVFLHKVGPEGTRNIARVYKLLVGAADSKLYYWNYVMIKHRSDDAFQLKDLKRIR